MDGVAVIVQNDSPGDGGTTGATTPTSPGSIRTPGQQLVREDKSFIITEEREGRHMTVGQKPRWCSCPTELLGIGKDSWAEAEYLLIPN